MDAEVASVPTFERRSGRQVEVSIVIPTFRRTALLVQALASAAAQDCTRPFEIVIVDNDDSADSTAMVRLAEACPVRDLRCYRNARNLGMFGNWNRCLDLARGRWVTILNDDDMLEPEFLTECLALVDRCPDAVAVACRARTLDERPPLYGPVDYLRTRLTRWRVRRLEGRVRRLNALDYFIHNPHQGSLGILMRAQVARQAGGFDADLYPSADWQFFSRLAIRHRVMWMERTLAVYRVLDNESKNATVNTGWVNQGLTVRAELASSLSQPRWLLNAYARLMAVQTARASKRFWRADFDVDATLARHRLRNWPVHAWVIGARWLLRRLDTQDLR